LARESLQRLSEELNGLDLFKLSEGILRIAVTKMASAIKEISVEKGHDPRDYALVPYGGAGPMHAAHIAEELGILTIMIPRFPGNLSALGLILSEVRQDEVRSRVETWKHLNSDILEKEFRGMEERALSSLEEEGFHSDRILFQRSLDLRYKGQAFELNLQIDGGDSLEKVAQGFHRRFQEAYGHGHPERDVELVNLRLSSFGLIEKPSFPVYEPKSNSAGEAQREERKVFFQGSSLKIPIYEREFLPCEEILNGPSIIEENGATTVVPPGWRCKVDAYGNLILSRRP
jgi:N-methylhydantoinase A